MQARGDLRAPSFKPQKGMGQSLGCLPRAQPFLDPPRSSKPRTPSWLNCHTGIDTGKSLPPPRLTLIDVSLRKWQAIKGGRRFGRLVRCRIEKARELGKRDALLVLSLRSGPIAYRTSPMRQERARRKLKTGQDTSPSVTAARIWDQRFTTVRPANGDVLYE